jgi:16S rRNA (guanine966-N2)-methyltransferase
VERDRSALQAIYANKEVLGEGVRVDVVARDVSRFLTGGAPPASRFGDPFDLVFVDPPYNTADEDITEILAVLAAPGWLAPGAIVSVERPRRNPVVAPPGLTTGWERTFGDTLLTFLFPEVL